LRREFRGLEGCMIMNFYVLMVGFITLFHKSDVVAVVIWTRDSQNYLRFSFFDDFEVDFDD